MTCADPDPDMNTLDEIAAMAVGLVLAAARNKEAALLALDRHAMDQYAVLAGHENASRHHARRSRIHAETGTNYLRKGIRR